MPTLKDLLCRPERQRPFILKAQPPQRGGADHARPGKVAAAEEKATTAALKPCDVVRTSVLPPHLPGPHRGLLSGALTESSSAVLTFALSLLLLFPAAVAEAIRDPVNYAPLPAPKILT